MMITLQITAIFWAQRNVLQSNKSLPNHNKYAVNLDVSSAPFSACRCPENRMWWKPSQVIPVCIFCTADPSALNCISLLQESDHRQRWTAVHLNLLSSSTPESCVVCSINTTCAGQNRLTGTEQVIRSDGLVSL
jgi:hypothetical protein